jgi:hypothetical protein
MRPLLALALVATVAVTACQAEAPGAASGRVVDGAFTVEITSPKSQYAAAEVIQVSATLTYTGPAASIRISHALQTIGFGIDGFLNGNVRPIYAFKCASSELRRGEPMMVPFAKTGGTMTPDPSFDAFMSGSALQLPPGVWHVYAEAEFSEGGCADPGHDIRAEIVLTVARG